MIYNYEKLEGEWVERRRYELIGAGTERGRCSIREFLLS